ncbi:hypothetical protein HanXRQr2_Chr09g0408891 [Helianthus annuus]|uniref:Uncharacterized protein n=1 Tax=Helianthus annuus TaxID=4232 RepID=A0A9K3N9U1_HELAN|nr:hypothetical protein HanXRQr2_Chr09g0408891 [Helianthus annuus]KAJ0894956.1 hypothetical protein HanPSC8_Chr09g0394861 [Helianthus annuus]
MIRFLCKIFRHDGDGRKSGGFRHANLLAKEYDTGIRHGWVVTGGGCCRRRLRKVKIVFDCKNLSRNKHMI